MAATQDEVQSADNIEAKREQIMEKVRSDAKQMRKEAVKAGKSDDYDEIEIETDAGTWTLKWDGSSIKYLRFSNGIDVYVISQYDPAEITPFVKAMKDYDSFVAGFNEWLADQEDELDELMDSVEDAEVDN